MAFFGPTQEDIEVVRGDSPVIPLSVTSGGAPVDITGGTFELAVDTQAKPVDNSTSLFIVSGVIVSGPAGTVTFQPSSAELNLEPKTYYYDIQMLLNGSKRTLLKGKFIVQQDINKN